MKDNFFNSMVSEGGKISHKRVISVAFAVFAIWAGIYIVTHYKEYALTVFGYTLISIGILTGVATLPQIVSLIRGGSAQKEDEPKKDNP